MVQLTARQAAGRLGVSRGLIEVWARNGCAYLAGERLKCERPTSGRKGITYDAAQVEDIAAARERMRQAGAADYLSFPEAHDRFGFRQAWLYRWRDRGSPWLEGERLLARQEPRAVGTNVRPVWVYSLDQLAQIARTRGKQRRGILQTPQGSWLSAARAEEDYGIFNATLGEWRSRPCPFLG